MNCQLISVNQQFANPYLIQDTVPVMEPDISSMVGRMLDAAGPDKAPTIAKKLQLAGFPVSHQAVDKWLKGGEVSEASLAAFCRLYDRNPAWIRYGTPPRRPSESAASAAVDLVTELPDDIVQGNLDFMGYQIRNSAALDPARINHYMKLLDRLKGDMLKRKKQKHS